MSQPPVKEKDLTLHWLPLSLTVQWTRSEWDGKMSESCVLLSPGRPTVQLAQCKATGTLCQSQAALGSIRGSLSWGQWGGGLGLNALRPSPLAVLELLCPGLVTELP